jgi:hypothetical protein
MKFINFFLFLWVIFALLDPNSIRIKHCSEESWGGERRVQKFIYILFPIEPFRRLIQIPKIPKVTRLAVEMRWS